MYLCERYISVFSFYDFLLCFGSVLTVVFFFVFHLISVFGVFRHFQLKGCKTSKCTRQDMMMQAFLLFLIKI